MPTLPRLTAVLALLLVLAGGLYLLISTTLQAMYSNQVWFGARERAAAAS